MGAVVRACLLVLCQKLSKSLLISYRCLQTSDRLEHVATEHFWMSGMYWGLTAMQLLGRLDEMDQSAIVDWILQCQANNGGFGGSARNDPHLLYTLSAVQILALYDKLELVDTDKIVHCEFLSMFAAAS